MSKAFKIVAVAIAAAGAALAVLVKKSIDNADRMAKMSREIGISTEALSVFKREAELGGTDIETFGTGLQRLARNLSDAQNGLMTAKRAFTDLGIEVLDANGNLRNIEEVTIEVADRFSQMEDGTRKTARAMELMGRGGVKLINTLNTLGEKGFAQARREAELFGEIVSTETAVAAEKFNDNLRDLGAIVSGVGITIAAELLPQLNRLTDSAKDFATQGEGAKRLAEKIADAFKLIGAAGLTAAFAFNKLNRAVTTFSGTGDFLTEIQVAEIKAREQIRILRSKISKALEEGIGEEALASLRRKLEAARSELRGLSLLVQEELGKIKAGGGGFPDLFPDIGTLEQLGEQISKLFSDVAVDVEASTNRVKTSLDDLNKSFKGTAVEADFLAPAIGKITNANKFFSDELRKSLGLQRGQQEAFANAPKLFADANAELQHIAANLDLANAGVQGLGGAFEAVTPKLEQLKDVGQQFTSSIASGFANLITRGGKLSDVFKNLASQLAGMLLQIALLNTLKSVFGGGGILGFQHGGRPQVGRPALVGEAGPELFVPDRSGSIISNQALQSVARGVGGKTVNINLNVDARGAGPGVMAEIRRGLRVAAKEIRALTKADIVEASLRSA